MRVKYTGDDTNLYNRTFDVLEEFQYSFNIDADGVKYRVSINDCEIEEEDNDTGNRATVDN